MEKILLEQLLRLNFFRRSPSNHPRENASQKVRGPCWHCGSFGHVNRSCPVRIEVNFLSSTSQSPPNYLSNNTPQLGNGACWHCGGLVILLDFVQ